MHEKKKIILVDDNPATLTACRKVLKDLYDVYPAPSAEKMFELLDHVLPDLILLDVEMPGTNGYDAMRMLNRYDDFRNIPVVFLTAMDDTKSEMEGLNLGAVDYIHKPFDSALLIRRLEMHFAVIESKKELSLLNRSIEGLLAEKETLSDLPAETKKEALAELLAKTERFTKLIHEVRSPLNTVIELIESAIKEENIVKSKSYLIDADAETRLILEIINGLSG